MRIKVPESNPAINDRINAVNRICKNEFGEVQLEIDPICKELIEDFEQVISDGRGGIKKTFNRKDPYYKRTHTSDALGYWVALEAPIRPIRAEQRGSRVSIPSAGYIRSNMT
jgi:hypothetical protein